MGAYQILYLHVPSFFAAFTGFFLGLVASGMYLETGNFKYDSFAAGVNEVALMFATAGLASGMIWARYAWGIWWAWDARLTSMLVCWLVYVGLPDPAAVGGGADAAGAAVGRAFDLRVRERGFRVQVDRLVSHPTSQPVLSIRTGGGRHGPGPGSAVSGGTGWRWCAWAS